MGTQNLRLELSRDLIDVESIRMNEQQKIDSKKEIEERGEGDNLLRLLIWPMKLLHMD